MEPNPTIIDTVRAHLFSEIQRAFNQSYPYLSLEKKHSIPEAPSSDKDETMQAFTILFKDIGLTDEMTVASLEAAIQRWLGQPVQVLRKNGRSWMETNMTRGWTLRQQNEQGRHIETGFD